MAQALPTNILRNTATLEAWRAYNRKAHAPLFLAMAPSICMSALTPVMIVLLRHNHVWLPFAIFLACEVAVLVWLVVAGLKVLAYKRATPFAPPPPVTWSDRKRSGES